MKLVSSSILLGCRSTGYVYNSTKTMEEWKVHTSYLYKDLKTFNNET